MKRIITLVVVALVLAAIIAVSASAAFAEAQKTEVCAENRTSSGDVR